MQITKKQLIRMSRAALDGEIDPSSAEKLEADDFLYFLTMFSVGSCVRVGTISRETGARFALKANQMYDLLSSRLQSLKAVIKKRINDRRTYGTVCTEVSRELNKDKPDAEKLIKSLCAALDKLTGDDVYLDMLCAALKNPDFLRDCQQAIINHENDLEIRFGGVIEPENYIHMLYKFYDANVRDGIAEWFKDFGIEPPPIFEKADNPRESVKRILNTYEKRRM